MASLIIKIENKSRDCGFAEAFNRVILLASVNTHKSDIIITQRALETYFDIVCKKSFGVLVAVPDGVCLLAFFTKTAHAHGWRILKQTEESVTIK